MLLRFALICLLSACARPPERVPLAWQAALPGLEYAHVEVPAGTDAQPVAVHVVRLDPRKWSMRVVTPQQMGKPLGSPADFRAVVPESVVAINGGFFDPQWKPLGLLVSAGQVLSPLRRVDHGIFAIAAGEPFMRHARDWKDVQGLDFAVECGPRLMVDGHPLTFKPGTARRSVIARDRKGRVLLIATGGVMGLTELTAFLQRSPADGGPGVTDALNLDGGPSTMLEVDAGAVHVLVPTPVQVPVGLVVAPRPK